MNIENIKKVLRKIDEHPEQWDQSSWHSDCGTKACFAGHAQIMSGMPASAEFTRRDARIFFDMTLAEADWAFHWLRTKDELDALANRNGYDHDGYDLNGYDLNGYDRDGLDANKKPKQT